MTEIYFPTKPKVVPVPAETPVYKPQTQTQAPAQQKPAATTTTPPPAKEEEQSEF